MKAVTHAAEYFDSLTQWKEECLLLREIIFRAGLEETVKWGGPCYTWQGENVVGIASFKNYAGLWFFQGGLLKDEGGHLMNAQENKTKAMRQWRFSGVDEIEKAPILDYVLESIENFKAGKKIKAETQKEIEIPEILKEALQKDYPLRDAWESLSRGCKREYAEYILQAKKEETRLSRIQKIRPMILEKKGLNDKYK